MVRLTFRAATVLAREFVKSSVSEGIADCVPCSVFLRVSVSYSFLVGHPPYFASGLMKSFLLIGIIICLVLSVICLHGPTSAGLAPIDSTFEDFRMPVEFREGQVLTTPRTSFH